MIEAKETYGRGKRDLWALAYSWHARVTKETCYIEAKKTYIEAKRPIFRGKDTYNRVTQTHTRTLPSIHARVEERIKVSGISKTRTICPVLKTPWKVVLE